MPEPADTFQTDPRRLRVLLKPKKKPLRNDLEHRIAVAQQGVRDPSARAQIRDYVTRRYRGETNIARAQGFSAADRILGAVASAGETVGEIRDDVVDTMGGWVPSLVAVIVAVALLIFVVKK